jgi:hypothetical protein
MYIIDNYETIQIQKMEISQLIFEQPYNREVEQKWWKPRTKDGVFNVHLLNPIHVSLRKDGKYYVVDGRHRLCMLIDRGFTWVWCVIHIDLEYTEEARFFVDINEQNRKVTAKQGFIGLTEAKDNSAMEINNILAEYKFFLIPNKSIVSIDQEYGKISCVSEVKKLYTKKLKEETFIKTFDIINKTWSGHPKSLKKKIIDGVANFLVVYEEDNVPDEELINIWKNYSPHSIVVEGNYAAKMEDNNSIKPYGRKLLELYNFGKPDKERLLDKFDLIPFNNKNRKKSNENKETIKQHNAKEDINTVLYSGTEKIDYKSVVMN